MNSGAISEVGRETDVCIGIGGVWKVIDFEIPLWNVSEMTHGSVGS